MRGSSAMATCQFPALSLSHQDKPGVGPLAAPGLQRLARAQIRHLRSELRVGLPAPELRRRTITVVPELLGELDRLVVVRPMRVVRVSVGVGMRVGV